MLFKRGSKAPYISTYVNFFNAQRCYPMLTIFEIHQVCSQDSDASKINPIIWKRHVLRVRRTSYDWQVHGNIWCSWEVECSSDITLNGKCHSLLGRIVIHRLHDSSGWDALQLQSKSREFQKWKSANLLRERYSFRVYMRDELDHLQSQRAREMEAREVRLAEWRAANPDADEPKSRHWAFPEWIHCALNKDPKVLM